MSTVSFAAAADKKRKHDAITEEEPTEQEVAAMSRSERKRHREKKRRSDVNKGFDELMSLLLEIDPEVRADAEERASKGQCKRSLGAHEDNVLSRVDLIGTAVRVLRRVHTENEKHKKMIEDFLKNKGDSVPRAASLAAGDAAANLNAFHALDRSSLLQGAGLGLGAAGAGPLDAQLRAKAQMFARAGLQDYTTADLLAFRAARQPAQSAASDAALLSQLNANKQALQRNLFMQNMLNGSGQGGLDSLYGSLGSDPSAQATPSFSIAEGLYGALGGGARAAQTPLQRRKEEELRHLRAATGQNL
jgi:Helix-loop-helix DNA-binding domain